MSLCKTLVADGTVSRPQMQAALSTQRSKFARLGDILVEQGMLSAATLHQAVERYSESLDGRFGDFLVASGYMAGPELARALELQQSRVPSIGAILVEKGLISQARLSELEKELSHERPQPPARLAPAAALGAVLLLACPMAAGQAETSLPDRRPRRIHLPPISRDGLSNEPRTGSSARSARFARSAISTAPID